MRFHFHNFLICPNLTFPTRKGLVNPKPFPTRKTYFGKKFRANKTQQILPLGLNFWQNKFVHLLCLIFNNLLLPSIISFAKFMSQHREPLWNNFSNKIFITVKKDAARTTPIKMNTSSNLVQSSIIEPLNLTPSLNLALMPLVRT